MFKLMKVHWKQATVVDPGPTCLEMSFCGTAWTVLGWIGFNMHVAAKADLTCRPECFINLSHVVMCIYVYTVYGVCMYIYIWYPLSTYLFYERIVFYSVCADVVFAGHCNVL